MSFLYLLRKAPKIFPLFTRNLGGLNRSAFHSLSKRPLISSRAPLPVAAKREPLAGPSPKGRRSVFLWFLTPQYTGYATSVTPHSSPIDPAEAEALRCLEQGTARLEEGDVHAAKSLYQRSVEIKRNASSLFNLGVTHYHLSMSSPGVSHTEREQTIVRFRGI